MVLEFLDVLQKTCSDTFHYMKTQIECGSVAYFRNDSYNCIVKFIKIAHLECYYLYRLCFFLPSFVPPADDRHTYYTLNGKFRHIACLHVEEQEGIVR